MKIGPKDQLAINTLRINGAAAVNAANSGHPGIVLGAAPMMHTLFAHFLNFDIRNPRWVNRDRFILSAGHGSALLYAQLRLLGLLDEKDLRTFRKLDSRTPGHPEIHLTPGVEATTGPLGQGIAMAVGVAMAEAHLHSRFKEIDHYTYVLCGDGDLQEGVAMEAMSLAGRQALNKLIILHDSNDIQLDTPVSKVNAEHLEKRMAGINWNYIKVSENNAQAIANAIDVAKQSPNQPTFIEVKTIIGEGATKEGTCELHGAPLGADFACVKDRYGWKDDDFAVPEAVNELYRATIISRGQKAFDNWKASPKLATFLQSPNHVIDLSIAKDMATRDSSGAVIKHLNATVPQWIGGSADLSGSTKAAGADGEFDVHNRQGRNILFGVREFAMAAIGNGLALHSNLKPFVSTFFVFSDYLKPAIRLAALMQLPTTFIFTHDSIFVGEDGPTHQPVEHIAMMRAIPNVNFLRPADEKEVIGAYEVAINATSSPTVLALTRQKIKSLMTTSSTKVKRGLYHLRRSQSPWTLVASGSELANAYALGVELDLNVVSISNYKGKVTWDIAKAISIEAATTYGLSRFAAFNIGIDMFGESGEGNAVYRHFQLDIEQLRKNVKQIIKRNSNN